MSGYCLSYKSTMYNPNIYTLKIVTISISMIFFMIIVFSLGFVSLCKVLSFFEGLYGEVTLL